MKHIEFCVVMIANGIFHPNGTSECVMVGRNLERQKVQGLAGKPIQHAPAIRLRHEIMV